ncbi:hypothetical protein BDV26DRAFT_199045 [Aspergillus bertholletiae]|uniref:Zn(2)-C6 fungal-type domain-containing protein n=1 Tax=Aspergillus bertholletiae TaxID=1226010 RepID=A0A5N7B8F6_9EURO|nr:hypothetical protein BDV26DRAFT_199045 [Aspergillus bertholletiae]
MVGIPGRSKGCRTCRRRRVKCDETKPYCTRCTKGGFHCDGYVEFVEFQDETKRFPQHWPAAERYEQTRIVISSPRTVIPSRDEDNIFTTHLIHKIFNQRDAEAVHLAATISFHLNQPEARAATDKSLALPKTSLRALSTTYFGRVHNRPDLLHRGSRWYSDALKELQLQLYHPQYALREDLLVVIIYLAIYESIAFTVPNAWLQHYKGLALLTAFRGPERHMHGVGFALYPTLRQTIAVGYIANRQRCFLEEPAWKTIPWAAKPGSKTLIDDLHDILCDAPGLLEGVDSFRAGGGGVTRAELCQKALAMLEELYVWRWKWEDTFPDASYVVSVDANMQVSTAVPRPFDTVLWFYDFSRAQEVCLYDSVLLLVLRMCELLDCLPQPVSTERANDPLLPMQGTRRDIAIEMLRLVDYHLDCVQGSVGALMLIFPLNVARRNLEWDTEIAWLDQVMAQIADMHGFEMGRAQSVQYKTE